MAAAISWGGVDADGQRIAGAGANEETTADLRREPRQRDGQHQRRLDAAAR